MNVGSLFSGIGGIELGFERAGFRTEWFVECDKYAQAVLRKNFPNTLIYDDIKKIDFKTIPKVDILTGGFPCQDISNAGRRAGIEGSRSSLWKYYLEAIRILRPKFAFIENVSALTGRGLNVVLADLASLGYDAEWHCVSASAVGAPHRRDRIFIIAYANGIGCVHRQDEKLSAKRGEQAQHDSESCCATSNDISVSDNHHDWKQCEESFCEEDEFCNPECGGCNRKSRWRAREKLEDGCGWAAEPDIRRVAHGVPNRVDRIRCLGNAVVPQVAEVFAQKIKEVCSETQRGA